MRPIDLVSRIPTKWEWRYYMLAQHISSWSKDPSTRVGAVVFGKDPREHCFGYNGFPPGLDDSPELYADRQLKYRRVQHAERNALDNARFSCVGGTLATTMFPCIECAKSLISKGITKVVTPRPPEPIAEPTWRDDCAYSVMMFQEVGIEVVWIGVIPSPCAIRHAGDSTWCETCRLAWDTNDTDPPPCKLKGK